jgi:hypothetical protein
MNSPATGYPVPPGLNVSFSRRTVLVTTDVLRAVRGVDAETIHAAVDDFELRWVFNISADPARVRELRFWTKEIIAPEFTRRLNLAKAINEILGEGRSRWRGVEIQHLLLVSRPTIMRLHRHGDLPGKVVKGTFWTPRPALESFLRTRWHSAALGGKGASS